MAYNNREVARHSAENPYMDPRHVNPNFTTPDYIVPRKLKANKQGRYNEPTILSEEQLLAVHSQFVDFREKLRVLGYLPADENFTREISFIPEDPTRPYRSMVYKVSILDRFFNSSSSMASRRTKWGYVTQAPSMKLFETNLLRPKVFGFSANNSKLFHEAFNSLLSVDPNDFTKRHLAATSLSAGLSYDEALMVLDIVKKAAVAELEAYDVKVTDENFIRSILITRFVERGYSYLGGVGGWGDGVHEDLKGYIYDLIRNDVTLYNALVALSPEANREVMALGTRPELGKIRLPENPVDMFVELNEVPELYVSRMLMHNPED